MAPCAAARREGAVRCGVTRRRRTPPSGFAGRELDRRRDATERLAAIEPKEEGTAAGTVERDVDPQRGAGRRVQREPVDVDVGDGVENHAFVAHAARLEEIVALQRFRGERRDDAVERGHRELPIAAEVGDGGVTRGREAPGAVAEVFRRGADATGIEFAPPLADIRASVWEDVRRITTARFVPTDVVVSGLIYDVDTGKLDLVVDPTRARVG